jgi:dihydrofolate reductase
MIALIVAMDQNRVIGKDNRMPWHLPADLAYFKQLTLGHPVIMGRKTFESLGKPLPGRQNIIITANQTYQNADCLVIHTIDEALDYCKDQDAFVIGGAQIYKEFFPSADRLYVTLIEQTFSGDTFFTEITDHLWTIV